MSMSESTAVTFEAPVISPMVCRDYIDCPHCKRKIHCSACAKLEDQCKTPKTRLQSAGYGLLKCRKCASRECNELEGLRFNVEQKTKRIRELESELREAKENHSKVVNDVTKASEKAIKKEQRTHRIAVKRTEKKLLSRLNFLQLQVPKSFQAYEPEAVALAFHGNPWIWAHRHILVSRLLRSHYCQSAQNSLSLPSFFTFQSL